MNLILSIFIAILAAGGLSWWIEPVTAGALAIVSLTFGVTQGVSLFLLGRYAPQGLNASVTVMRMRTVLMVLFGIVLCVSLGILLFYPELNESI